MYFEDRRGRIHYEVYGDGPWIVLCHALGTDLSVWSQLVAPLSESFSVLNFDLRGHGKSAPAADGDYSFEAMSDDVRSLLREVGAPSASVMGISVGGEVAQVFATRHPEITRALLLCSTACVTGEQRAALWNQRIAEVEASGMNSIAAASASRWFTKEFRARDHATVEAFRERLAQMAPQVYISMARTIQQMDLRPRIRDLRCPTLVICGDDDANTGPEAARILVENIPSAQLSIVQAVAHFPNVEAPGRFNPLVLEWLSRPVREQH